MADGVSFLTHSPISRTYLPRMLLAGFTASRFEDARCRKCINNHQHTSRTFTNYACAWGAERERRGTPAAFSVLPAGTPLPFGNCSSFCTM